MKEFGRKKPGRKPGRMGAKARYMVSHPICGKCAQGLHSECNGTARLPDEYNPIGIRMRKPFPAFAPCECAHDARLPFGQEVTAEVELLN